MSAVEVHQTLHGYSDGHRLLAASRRLPPDTERMLLIMTDISGPVTAGMFDSYLTGFGLPGGRAYALARTWLAAELNRPGCVWTHTLIVEREDLGRIADLRALCALHRRPRKGEAWQPYGQPLRLPLPAPAPEAPAAPVWSERAAARTLAALYGVPDVPTFLEAHGAEHLEDLVLAMWTQAWPTLRAALRFSTWSLAPRLLQGAPLDLQVVPPTVSRNLRHTGITGTLVTPVPRFGHEPDTLAVPAWARAAARDLVGEPAGELRAFMWEFGDDVPALRSSFARLVEVHGAVEAVRQDRASVGQLVDTLGVCFASPQTARRLKAVLFGERAAAAARWPPTVREADVLGALATTAHQAGLDADALGLRRRAGALWAADAGQALELTRLVGGTGAPGPLGAELLAGLAEAAPPGEAAGIREGSPDLFAALVERNPALAAPVPALSATPPPAPGRPAAPPLPSPPAEEVVRPARPEPGSVKVADILDRLDRAERPEDLADFTAEWDALLANNPVEVADWLARAEAPRAGTLAVAVSVLDLHAPEVSRIPVEVWIKASADAESELDQPAQIRLMAFLLALAFADRSRGAAALAARAFGTVDRAAATGELTSDVWHILAAELPALPWWRDWDRGERLRRGLVTRLLRERWPPAVLLEAARDGEAFQRLVEICEWTRDGEAVLRQLAGQVARRGVEATAEQRALLARYA